MSKEIALEAVIGLEVHVQLKTKSKMFCSCDNRDGQQPNAAICPVCTAQPGALPVPNQQAIDWAIMTSLALGCHVNQESKFDRKSYFYPDLPKGYQISQYDKPFGEHGSLAVLVGKETKTFRIHRLHLEEDAGKLIHPAGSSVSLVDLNRAGTPLMEIVSEPDFRTPQEAKAYMQELQLMMRYLDVSDADMELGHLRCDANISLRPKGEDKLYPKTEIKNMNSFRAIERGIAFEIERQTALWEDGQAPSVSSTRGWDEASGKTIEQRVKEEEADYRYFPEPDIPAIITSDEHLAELQNAIPELPAGRRARLQSQYSLSSEVSDSLVADQELGAYFEEVMSEFQGHMNAELGEVPGNELMQSKQGEITSFVANWLLNRISAEHRAAHHLSVSAEHMAHLLWLAYQGVISIQASTTVYEEVRKTQKEPRQVIQELGLEQVSDTEALQQIVADVIAANEKVVAEIRAGKTAGVQFLVGQVMKQTKGKANPQVVQEILNSSLGL